MQIIIFDDTGAAPPEIGVLTVTVRHDAGFELKNEDSTSFGSQARYTFDQAGTEYGVTGNFGTAGITLVDIAAISAEPPPVIHGLCFGLISTTILLLLTLSSCELLNVGYHVIRFDE